MNTNPIGCSAGATRSVVSQYPFVVIFVRSLHCLAFTLCAEGPKLAPFCNSKQEMSAPYFAGMLPTRHASETWSAGPIVCWDLCTQDVAKDGGALTRAGIKRLDVSLWLGETLKEFLEGSCSWRSAVITIYFFSSLYKRWGTRSGDVKKRLRNLTRFLPLLQFEQSKENKKNNI